MKQEITGWQWHQLDQMQIVCTSLQTDNYTSTSSNFYRPDALPGSDSCFELSLCLAAWAYHMRVGI